MSLRLTNTATLARRAGVLAVGAWTLVAILQVRSFAPEELRESVDRALFPPLEETRRLELERELRERLDDLEMRLQQLQREPEPPPRREYRMPIQPKKAEPIRVSPV